MLLPAVVYWAAQRKVEAMSDDILDRLGKNKGPIQAFFLIEDVRDEITRLRARVAFLERPATAVETSAAYDAFYQGGNINDNAMTLALAAALEIRMRAAK